MILAIYCAGGLGSEICGLARCVNRWEQIIFVDDVTDDKFYCGASVFRFDEIEQFRGNIEFVIASGEPMGRAKLYDKIKAAGYPLTSIVIPEAMGANVQIGEGCIIFDCSISTNITVASNVLINSKVIIGHDVNIGEHCVIGCLCFVGGHANLAERVYVAPGTMIKDRVSIGADAILALGAVILRSVKEKAIMLGNPAHKIGENTEHSVFNMFK